MAGKIHTRSGLKLTPLQEAFAQAYTDFSKASFGNAYKSLLATRDFKGKRSSAYSYAYQLLHHRTVEKRVLELLEYKGLSTEEVNVEHFKVIKQDKDLSAKIRAIQEYNRIYPRMQKGAPVVNIIDFSPLVQKQAE